MTTQATKTVSASDRKTMDSVCKDLSTKSAKIRALDAKGYSRADISRYLKIRYQHVRNVLITPVKNPGK